MRSSSAGLIIGILLAVAGCGSESDDDGTTNDSTDDEVSGDDMSADDSSADGDDSPMTQPDAPTTPDTPPSDSLCGQPGDVGNELGIGKYCEGIGDCSGEAWLCSDIGDPNTHFCTKTCSSTGSPTQCGTGAECVCNESNQCGCTPSSCLD